LSVRSEVDSVAQWLGHRYLAARTFSALHAICDRQVTTL